uniref:Uncharacterized protein n=1 Tax=Aegilops tauschii subsp. strangulata TaxID=200361 RepID=A0A453BFJ4_AEGTS
FQLVSKLNNMYFADVDLTVIREEDLDLWQRCPHMPHATRFAAHSYNPSTGKAAIPPAPDAAWALRTTRPSPPHAQSRVLVCLHVRCSYKCP